MLLVVVTAAVVVAGMAHALSVAVVLVALAMPVMRMVGLGLRRAAMAVVVPPVLVGVVADAALWSRGDPTTAWALRGCDARAG